MDFAFFFTGLVIGVLAYINRDNIKLYATDAIRRVRG